MRHLTEYLSFNTTQHRDLVNITDTIEGLVTQSGVQEGLCLVSAMHITASIWVNDDEEGLWQDFWELLERLVPSDQDYKHHLTGEDNGDAHLKRTLIGHAGHEEVEGTMGEAPASIKLIQSVEDAKTVAVANPEKVAVITQTTLSVDDTRTILDALKARFPKLVMPSKDDICYATQNRQNAVKAIAKEAEVILVIGAKNSSNSIRLTEVAESAGRRAYLINDASEIRPAWFDGVRCVGVTSGASAPEHLVQEVVASLQRLGASRVEERELVEEHVAFGLPAIP